MLVPHFPLLTICHRGGPHTPGKMGTRGPHFPRKVGTRVPIFPGIWGPGVPILGGPHFPMTPAQLLSHGVVLLLCGQIKGTNYLSFHGFGALCLNQQPFHQWLHAGYSVSGGISYKPLKVPPPPPTHTHTQPPPLPHRSVVTDGISSSACFTVAIHIPRQAVWGYVFGLSKAIELGDTVFIVLRKTPLSFLHWYHHITVFVFTWASLADPPAVTHWFGMMNFIVHSLMYTYYGCRASGWRIPSKVALTITVLQLLQMFMGVYITILSYLQRGDERCEVREDLFLAAVGMYASYALLFMNFLYQRYIK